MTPIKEGEGGYFFVAYYEDQRPEPARAAIRAVSSKRDILCWIKSVLGNFSGQNTFTKIVAFNG